jgi:hypothetical protein
MPQLRNSIDVRRAWLKAFGLTVALGVAQPVHAAQALLVCTVLQTPTQDDTNTEVRILNNCCGNLPAETRITVTAGQKGVAAQSITLALPKPLMMHKTTVFGFYVSVPAATWCSAARQ